MNLFEYKINTLSKEILSHYMNKWSDFFNPPLKSYVVSIEAYSEKIIDNACVIEAYYENELVGLLSVYLNLDIAFITQLVVIPEFQGCGLAKGLLEEAVKKAKEKKIETVELECFSSDIKAKTFYIKQGFKELEQRNNKILMELKI